MSAPDRVNSATPIPPVLLDDECERIRVASSVAFMLSGALEVQARIARDVDPELHRMLSAAHGQALHVMARERARLLEARRAFKERQQREKTA